MDVLRRDLKLLIDDYGKDQLLSDKIRGYYDLLSDYMAKRQSEGVVHIPGDYRSFM